MPVKSEAPRPIALARISTLVPSVDVVAYIPVFRAPTVGTAQLVVVKR